MEGLPSSCQPGDAGLRFFDVGAGPGRASGGKAVAMANNAGVASCAAAISPATFPLGMPALSLSGPAPTLNVTE